MSTLKLKIRNDLIKKRKPGVNTETKIFVQYCFEGRVKMFDTGVKVDPRYWEDKKQCVRKDEGYTKYKSINLVIRKRKSEIEEIISSALFNNVSPTIDYIERKVAELRSNSKDGTETSLFLCLQDIIQGADKSLKPNTLKSYRTLKCYLVEFEASKKYRVTFESINSTFHQKFTGYLINEMRLNPNSVGTVLTVLKSFLAKMTALKLNKNLDYKSFTKPEPVPSDSIALTFEELNLIQDIDLSKRPSLDKARDLLVLSCNTGLRYSDVSTIRPECIKERHLDIITIKTKQRLIIPLADPVKRIIAKYNGVLPKFTGVSQTNVLLKELGEYCGIASLEPVVRYEGALRINSSVPKYKLFSSHLGRRTFCTLRLEAGMRPETLQKITGHTNLRVLMKYVKISESVVETEFLRSFERRLNA